jgi:nucleotide-binding universal stress UspA family protein
MPQLTRILHPTDFSDCARQALVQAARLAQAHGAELHVFHAVLLHEQDPQRHQKQMQEYLALAAQEGAAGVKSSEARSASPYEAIAQRVDELAPDLIVLGTHGRSALGHLLMGSVAEKVLRHAPCDIMTLRADARPGPAGGRFHRVLVPVDFSEHAKRALARARGLAAAAGGALTLLHVVEPLPPMFLAGGLEHRAQLDPDMPGRVEKHMQEWAGDASLPARMAEGQSARQIVRTADELGADLIVMGTRGLTGISHALVGSVTERVCRSAHVPVLVVR